MHVERPVNAHAVTGPIIIAVNASADCENTTQQLWQRSPGGEPEGGVLPLQHDCSAEPSPLANKAQQKDSHALKRPHSEPNSIKQAKQAYTLPTLTEI